MSTKSTTILPEFSNRAPQIWSIVISSIERLRKFNSELHRRRKIRADMEILRSMPDHILRDIGIDRFEIDYAVEHGRVIDRITEMAI